MMLLVPSCYLNVLSMIHCTPFLLIENPSRIVELQDLRCHHGFVDDGQPSKSVEFRWFRGFVGGLMQCLVGSVCPSTYSMLAPLLPGESFSVVHVSKRERGNLTEQWIVRIRELEREIVFAHSCHIPHIYEDHPRLCWWMGSVHALISSSKRRSGENMHVCDS